MQDRIENLLKNVLFCKDFLKVPKSTSFGHNPSCDIYIPFFEKDVLEFESEGFIGAFKNHPFIKSNSLSSVESFCKKELEKSYVVTTYRRNSNHLEIYLNGFENVICLNEVESFLGVISRRKSPNNYALGYTIYKLLENEFFNDSTL